VQAPTQPSEGCLHLMPKPARQLQTSWPIGVYSHQHCTVHNRLALHHSLTPSSLVIQRNGVTSNPSAGVHRSLRKLLGTTLEQRMQSSHRTGTAYKPQQPRPQQETWAASGVLPVPFRRGSQEAEMALVSAMVPVEGWAGRDHPRLTDVAVFNGL
jgi:hypothetical protein